MDRPYEAQGLQNSCVQPCPRPRRHRRPLAPPLPLPSHPTLACRPPPRPPHPPLPPPLPPPHHSPPLLPHLSPCQAELHGGRGASIPGLKTPPQITRRGRLVRKAWPGARAKHNYLGGFRAYWVGGGVPGRDTQRSRSEGGGQNGRLPAIGHVLLCLWSRTPPTSLGGRMWNVGATLPAVKVSGQPLPGGGPAPPKNPACSSSAGEISAASSSPSSSVSSSSSPSALGGNAPRGLSEDPEDSLPVQRGAV